MEDTNGGLAIDILASGVNGKARVTATLNGEVIAVDELNLTKQKARAEFCKTVCDGRPGIKRKEIEAELLKAAAAMPVKGQQQLADHELDLSSIVRPERIITPIVNGISIPTMTTIGDKPVGRWLLYLQWNDGTRERIELPTFLDLPDESRLWIHPVPGEPSPNTAAGWSAVNRREWLAGCEPPDPTAVFQNLCSQVAHFVELPPNHAPGTISTLALWSILSYGYHAWSAIPYLYVGGPLGSGKTRVFEILNRVCFRALSSSNMTGPALFRTLHSQGGTLLLDEAERLKQAKDPGVQELLSMLLAGYKAGGKATRLETVGDSFKTVDFDVFGPKAMSCIAGLPPALSSRAIHIMMFRCDKGSEVPKRRIDENPASWQRLRDDLHQMALSIGPVWMNLPYRSDVCPDMGGRDFELWQPLLALAAWLDDEGADGLLDLMKEYALTCIDQVADDQVGDADEILLRILAEKRLVGGQPTAGEILKTAKEEDSHFFDRWTPKAVANGLKRYGLHTNVIRGRRVYGKVTLEDLLRIQKTYGILLDLEEETQSDHTHP